MRIPSALSISSTNPSLIAEAYRVRGVTLSLEN